MQNIPSELINIIKNFYLDILHFEFHKSKIKNLHNQLKFDQPILNISEDTFDWFLDFEYAIRLPKLICITD